MNRNQKTKMNITMLQARELIERSNGDSITWIGNGCTTSQATKYLEFKGRTSLFTALETVENVFGKAFRPGRFSKKDVQLAREDGLGDERIDTSFLKITPKILVALSAFRFPRSHNATKLFHEAIQAGVFPEDFWKPKEPQLIFSLNRFAKEHSVIEMKWSKNESPSEQEQHMIEALRLIQEWQSAFEKVNVSLPVRSAILAGVYTACGLTTPDEIVATLHHVANF